MWKNNRPEGWVNLHNDIESSRSLRVGTLRTQTSDFKIYEAGADAMLEAQKHQVGSHRNKGNSGWFVFIPD